MSVSWKGLRCASLFVDIMAFGPISDLEIPSQLLELLLCDCQRTEAKRKTRLIKDVERIMFIPTEPVKAQRPR